MGIKARKKSCIFACLILPLIFSLVADFVEAVGIAVRGPHYTIPTIDEEKLKKLTYAEIQELEEPIPTHKVLFSAFIHNIILLSFLWKFFPLFFIFSVILQRSLSTSPSRDYPETSCQDKLGTLG